MLHMMRFLPKGCVFSETNSPVGRLSIIASNQGLHAILWDKDRDEIECERIVQSLKRSESQTTIASTKQQLREYFSGDRFQFDVPLILNGTHFQKRAWGQLVAIPYGETISYEEQARRLGDAKKARAVGSANARNPISIIVPCHRVIAKDGALIGFGGGLACKEILIGLEKKNKFPATSGDIGIVYPKQGSSRFQQHSFIGPR